MLLQADAFRIPLEDRSVHCVITSPPYWALRKYSGEQSRGHFPDLGLEKTPEEHIKRMVLIFREIKRVLRDDGVVWLNYGDSYFGDSAVRAMASEAFSDEWDKSQTASRGGPRRSAARIGGLRPGSLVMMPHRVAIALQEDWIVRNDVVWYKRNPMPEPCAGWRWESKPCDCVTVKREAFIAGFEKSGIPRHRARNLKPSSIPHKDDCPKCNGTGKVGDPILKKSSWRHTRAHEYVFQLVKNMHYYCNQEAVRETHSPKSFTVSTTPRKGTGIESKGEKFNLWLEQDGRGRQLNPSGRNPRSVLDVPTAPYKGAHYATFPPNLIAPLIRASCPRRSCPECGQAWAPVVEPYYEKHRPSAGDDPRSRGEDKFTIANETSGWRGNNLLRRSKILDYRPTCSHKHDPVPGIVLDPFIGSGTTGAVAKELQRRWIGLDISMDYLDQQAKVRALKLTPRNALEGLPLFDHEQD